MIRQMWREVCLDTDWTHARSAAAMGNAECFVQIHMGNIGSNISRLGDTDLSI